MAPRRTVTGKEAMASRRAAFLAARDRTHGKEAMASRRTEFIAAGGQTVTRADFEAAMAEWVVDLEAAKAAQKGRKRQKAVKKRDSCRRKKKEAAHRGERELGGDRSTMGFHLQGREGERRRLASMPRWKHVRSSLSLWY